MNRDHSDALNPKPHQLIVDHIGVTRWSPVFDSIGIESLPQGGKRIRVKIKNGDVADFDMTEEQIAHLVTLLVSSSSEGNAPLVEAASREDLISTMKASKKI